MYLVLLLFQLSESLCKDNIYCTACIRQDIVDQKSFYDIGYNHGIIVGIILELKVLLRECDWHMRPFGFDVGSLHSNMLYPSLRFLLLLLIGWFKTWATCDWEHQPRSRRCHSLVALRSHCRSCGSEFTHGGRQCWGLVLNCYELRTRQHKVLNVNVLRPWDIIPLGIMDLGRRLIRIYLRS